MKYKVDVQYIADKKYVIDSTIFCQGSNTVEMWDDMVINKNVMVDIWKDKNHINKIVPGK